MKNQTKIVRNATGARFVQLLDGSIIPAGIAALCSGKDKWMSELTCKCRTCKGTFALNQLSEDGQFCQECQFVEV